MIIGRIMNDFTKEPVSFASIYWKRAGFGTTSDSAGTFLLRFSQHPLDTLVVSYVGFLDVYRPIRKSNQDNNRIQILLKELKQDNTVTVKSKFNKGLRWWKLILANKAQNNPYQYQNYAYELYNKMELDINISSI